jgi:hypothetical protein
MLTPLHISAAAGQQQLRRTIAASVSIRAAHSAWMGAESLKLQVIIDSSWVLLRRPAPAVANSGMSDYRLKSNETMEIRKSRFSGQFEVRILPA